MEEILLITTDIDDRCFDLARERYGDTRVLVLNLDPRGVSPTIPPAWQELCMSDLLDEDALRSDFLSFLDVWPQEPLQGGRSFDQMFRRRSGYSVWWTGPGLARHPDLGIFTKLRTIWLFDRAMREHVPRRVLLCVADADLARAIVSRCDRDKCPGEILSGRHPKPAGQAVGRWVWMARTLAELFLFPWLVLLRALLARWTTRIAREEADSRATPAVVLASPLFVCFRLTADGVTLDWWQDFHDAMARQSPGTRCRFLVRVLKHHAGFRPYSRWYHTGWRLLRRMNNAIPLAEAQPALGTWIRSVPHHFSSLLRYCRLERTAALRDSLCFAGANVFGIYLEDFRQTFARLSQWEQSVGAVAASLQAAGNVRSLLVTEEMYPVGMVQIAAARRLGIPTIGIQHGTIYPMHLVYVLPKGQVSGAPLPDYFAVYGDYARDTVSRNGAFPRDRVWVTGSVRFDRLVSHPPDRAEARAALGLPQEKRIVLVATQLFPWMQRAVRAVFSTGSEIDGCLICIKTHPKDVPLEVYRRLAQDVGNRDVEFYADRFDDLLAASDVLISGSSTTILEAVLLGRKTICMNFSGTPDRYPYVENGGAVGARSEREIGEAMQRVFHDDFEQEWAAGRKRFLDHHAGLSAQGRAAEVLVERALAIGAEKP